MLPTRSEKDFLGNKEIPVDAYYGVHTARALDNFMVSGVPISHFPRFIIALAMVKITPNPESCQRHLDSTITLVTLLNPQLGYEVAAELAMEALTTNCSIRELVLERGLMSSEAYDALVKASASLD